jgi:hypothetical protein
MPAIQQGHGVITIHAPARAEVQEVKYTPPGTTITTGTPPGPVVQHKTVSDIQEEAAAVAKEAEQLISDAAGATQ